jgi:hypothetical protein
MSFEWPALPIIYYSLDHSFIAHAPIAIVVFRFSSFLQCLSWLVIRVSRSRVKSILSL